MARKTGSRPSPERAMALSALIPGIGAAALAFALGSIVGVGVGASAALGVSVLASLLTALPLSVADPRKGFGDTLEKPEEIFHSKCVIGSGTLCINRTGILLFIVFAVLAVILIAATSRPKLVPTGWQNGV